jgi:LysM repeat protein
MEGLGLVVDRRLLARYVAPVAFLLAVTAVVLVVRAGLRHHSAPARAATAAPQVVTTRVAARPVKPAPPKRWYVIQSGDTFEAVAGHYGTSVAALLKLNPGVDPKALVPGQRVRVR